MKTKRGSTIKFFNVLLMTYLPYCISMLCLFSYMFIFQEPSMDYLVLLIYVLTNPYLFLLCLILLFPAFIFLFINALLANNYFFSKRYKASLRKNALNITMIVFINYLICFTISYVLGLDVQNTEIYHYYHLFELKLPAEGHIERGVGLSLLLGSLIFFSIFLPIWHYSIRDLILKAPTKPLTEVTS